MDRLQLERLKDACRVYRDTNLWVQAERDLVIKGGEAPRNDAKILIIFDGPRAELPPQVLPRIKVHVARLGLEGQVSFEIRCEDG